MATKQEIIGQQTETLAQAARDAGRENGYDKTEVRTAQFRDFKVKWMRSCNWIEFEVSDYMLGMPYDEAYDLFTTLFDRIKGEDTPYTERTTAWITSEAFSEANRPVYIARSKAWEDAEVTAVHADLVARGLLPDDGVKVTVRDMAKGIGGSVLMRCAIVSRAVAAEGGDTLKKAVYLACRHAGRGFSEPFDEDAAEADARGLFGRE